MLVIHHIFILGCQKTEEYIKFSLSTESGMDCNTVTAN